jgi:hypothetical protein
MFFLKHGQTITAKHEDGTVTVAGVCRVTKKFHTVRVPLHGLVAWYHRGEMIQDALGEVSAEDREFIQTSTSPEGWELLFGEDEDGTFNPQGV